jgi:hypothetical protein
MIWMRRSALVGVISAASLLAWPTAVGAGAPIGECPTGAWELRAAPSGGSGLQSVDVNGNGLSCFLQAPEGSGLFTVIDDVARAPHA